MMSYCIPRPQQDKHDELLHTKNAAAHIRDWHQNVIFNSHAFYLYTISLLQAAKHTQHRLQEASVEF